MNKLNNKYIKEIYYGLISKKNIREIHKNIRKITLAQKNSGLPYDLSQEKYAVKTFKSFKKKVDNASFDTTVDLVSQISLFVYDLLKKNNIYQNMNKISYFVAKETEANEKNKVISDSLKENESYFIKIDWGDRYLSEEKVENAKIFYLISRHNDCAQDHKEYQGKIYIDSNWKRFIKSKELRQKIQDFIDKKNIKTFQWVIGKPVWLITRPNCRHYFEKVSFNEVDSNSIDDLLLAKKMSSEVGGTRGQTIKHSTKREWYTKENIENIIRKYEERLSYHQSLYDVQKNEELKRDIEKDKLLIKKWKAYLQNIK